MASKVYPERIEWIGRPPGSPLPHAIMVTLGVVSDDGFGGQQNTLRGPMGAQEAAALGFPVSKLVEGFNDAVAGDLASARAALAAMTAERDAVAADLAAVTADRDALAAQIAALAAAGKL